MALALLALVVVGAQPLLMLAHKLRDFAMSAWSGQLTDARSALRGLGSSMFWVLSIPALAALLGVLAQRAPTLRLFASNAAGQSQNEPRGRPARGRMSHNLIAALKGCVLAASLGVLLYDSLAGFFESSTRSGSQLLALTQHALPAYLLRAACACLVLAAIELGTQYVERARRLRMTPEQVQDEQRELSADPRLSSERRARTSELPERLAPQLRAAALSQLSAATLLLTGGNCVVALQYEPDKGVPTVLLTAAGPLAIELLQRAYTLDLPLAHDELLAPALSRLPARSNIPSEHHARVAQLLVGVL